MYTYFDSIWRNHKKAVSIISLIVCLMLFGDTLLPIIGHILHLLLEFVEALLEHFLENAFGLTARQAQILLFYSFITLASYLAWYVVRKTYYALFNVYIECKVYWRLIKNSQWFKATMMLGALGTTVYLFS